MDRAGVSVGSGIVGEVCVFGGGAMKTRVVKDTEDE